MEMLPPFSNSLLAKAWFSRSIRAVSFFLTLMLSDLGPTLLAAGFLYVAGPLMEEFLPWEISTNLFRRIWFSLFRFMFFSKQQEQKYGHFISSLLHTLVIDHDVDVGDKNRLGSTNNLPLSMKFLCLVSINFFLTILVVILEWSFMASIEFFAFFLFTRWRKYSLYTGNNGKC